MRSRDRHGAALALGGWALVATMAQAVPVQINPPPLGFNTGATGIEVQQPMGQSFIANGDSVHTVELQLLNMNISLELSQDRLVTLDLYEGVGFQGAHLASQTVDVDRILGRLAGTQGQVDFALGGVAVVPGQPYSFQLRAATARFGSVWFAGNAYADGHAILQGEAFDDPDLYFGIRAVSEPCSVLLLTAGLVLLRARHVTNNRKAP
ncbi:hypothetical protein [Pseudaquabacterium pictum]|uniref:PEP-CTERM protein-sorting domain-containing protein n=1 Tax=Pseudaquabacterium pictum TaxID=2315236 RepID=A0A480ATS4_9BURK|nr:hypothetical protein [Rubrivivax pictus]GCL65099.1 hypothetical protein AQPW35_41800 [Rubrivivax pictus]